MTQPRPVEATSAPPDPGPLKVFASLKTEMMLSLAVLGTAALSLAALNVVVLENLVMTANGAIYLALLIFADILVFVAFGAYKIQGLVLDPLDEVVDATAAIAAGDLSRRVPKGHTSEFNRLARSINRMTARLLEEQSQRTHLEKVASVGRLAAGVAHEIGNPLGAINGYAHILRRTFAGQNGEAADALAGLERESARIDRIMRGMLEYARPRRRNATRLDLNSTIQQTVELLRDQGNLREVKVHLDLQVDLPRMIGDCHEMEQVLVNLMINAVDAMEEKGSIWIVTQQLPFSEVIGTGERRAGDPENFAIPRDQSTRVRAWLNTVGEPSHIIKLIVADSGPGIPISDSERVFDPFYTTKDPGKGTGLGLAVVARIVEGLGGTVWVRQAREGGAAFMMYFPVAEQGVATEAEPASEAAARP
ncbi:MAG TPA: ATP-binding protein [Gemmatimonadaceae bacterium]|nr:ATP-binding protein [Gemmatimonadaceae bacterium]